MNIIVTERIAEVGIYYLRENGFSVEACLGISQAELLKIVSRYDGLIVRSVTRVDEELLANAKRLKIVGRAGNGLDNIDLPACTLRGIPVVNTPAANAMSTAELAVGLIFAAFRNIPQAYRAGKANDFRRTVYSGNELHGKTAGIVGLGLIGSLVADKLKALGLKVVAYDPYIADSRFDDLKAEKCETLAELLRRADVISLHVPKTPETADLIGAAELDLCKPGVRIVSTSRAGIINERALHTALRSAHVAAAGLDILDPEPDFESAPGEQDYRHPLLELDNAIITPHMGGSTEEAEHTISMTLARLITKAFTGQPITAVNDIARLSIFR
ncbi:hydroxyacid dehydrogenase [Anaeroselena agilis]|uniref:Hydroxyacid dehydrogenase n=1 Tax=Anaeroselena agilis TaxID=3063788 RepID=A0ABU3NSX0_9FIRM|nr:hydroxyacid dehydrogenase [Selenomonadales bacterium 4137-cl]